MMLYHAAVTMVCYVVVQSLSKEKGAEGVVLRSRGITVLGEILELKVHAY